MARISISGMANEADTVLEKKIATNRKRDNKNFSALRRRGWAVMRIWQHEIEDDLNAVATRIKGLVEAKRKKL